MSYTLTAQDLWHLVLKLPHEEQIRLAKFALHAAAISEVGSHDGAAYATMPVAEGEFSTDEDSLAWDAEGWEGFDVSR